MREMASEGKHLQFRSLLPVVQFTICLMILWPVRGRLLFGIEETLLVHTSTQENTAHSAVNLPELTDQQQLELAARARRENLHISAPVVLDFPAIIVQLPYILGAPVRREWVPQGMFPETWRALSWPFAGLVFWWLAGRGIDALRATRHGIVHPRLRWIEVAFASILVVIGIVTVVGIATSTPDDRNDIQFLALLAGGVLWGTLAGFVVAARFRQRRIAKRTAPERSQSPSTA